jgi:hypothetical protein
MSRKSIVQTAILSAVAAGALATAAQAHDNRLSNIAREQDRQASAIQSGRADGSLTWLEKFRLQREQSRIAKLEQSALFDGRLSKTEYKQIRQAQQDAQRHIHRERHDAQVRGWWWRMWN